MIKIFINYFEIELVTLASFMRGISNIFLFHQLFLIRQCIDIVAVDIPGRNFRFYVYYHFLSVVYNFRLRLLVQTSEVLPLETITDLFPNAAWSEREIWDLFGIFFLYNGDLRRILTDYGFFGTPFRKDFPLIGFFEISYSDVYKRVQYTTLELLQNYRTFNYTLSWKSN